MKKLTSEFYNRETTLVAKSLLGKHLVHKYEGITRIGKIVEVEAYLGAQDLGCHSSKGITKRTEVMFGPAGFSYIYLIYGMYHCFNVVTETVGIGSAVLIRALEPVENITERTQGPGLLCRAMKLNKEQNNQDLFGESLFITEPEKKQAHNIIETPRIGIAYAKDWASKPLRFYIEGNGFVSGRR